MPLFRRVYIFHFCLSAKISHSIFSENLLSAFGTMLQVVPCIMNENRLRASLQLFHWLQVTQFFLLIVLIVWFVCTDLDVNDLDSCNEIRLSGDWKWNVISGQGRHFFFSMICPHWDNFLLHSESLGRGHILPGLDGQCVSLLTSPTAKMGGALTSHSLNTFLTHAQERGRLAFICSGHDKTYLHFYDWFLAVNSTVSWDCRTFFCITILVLQENIISIC